MEGQVCFLLLTVLLSTVLNSALAIDIPSYSMAGETLVLTPPFSGSISSILWKHKNNLVVEWSRAEMEYYGMFNGRTTLDTTTGQLKIKNMTEKYAGLYTVELNGQDQPQQYQVTLIKKVPKPEVVLRPLTCSRDSDQCTLSCDGETSQVGPVTFRWKEEGGESVSETKDKIIVNNPETSMVQSFSCQMKNPVSEEESDPFPNPFIHIPASNGWIAAALLVPILVLIGFALLYWKRGFISQYLRTSSNQAAPTDLNVQPSQPSSPQPEGQPLTESTDLNS